MQSHVFSRFTHQHIGKSGFSSSWYFVKTNINGRNYKYLRNQKSWLQNITFIKLVFWTSTTHFHLKRDVLMLFFFLSISYFFWNGFSFLRIYLLSVSITFQFFVFDCSPHLNRKKVGRRWWENCDIFSLWYMIIFQDFQQKHQLW